MIEIPADRTFRHRQIRLGELAGDDGMITELVFEDCEIVGPAVMVFIGIPQFRFCEFKLAGSVDSVIWPWPNARNVLGCLGVKDCLFERCSFDHVGFTGDARTIGQLRAMLSGG